MLGGAELVLTDFDDSSAVPEHEVSTEDIRCRYRQAI